MVKPITIGILALQGAFDLHRQALENVSDRLNQEIAICEVRKPAHLENIDGIILPGGESTVLKKLLDSSGVGEQLILLIKAGLPNFGTCAGLILQSQYFHCIDCEIKRNAYGTQNDSFQTKITFNDEDVDAFFIRAPKITNVGIAKVISYLDGEPISLVQGSSLGLTFHPEVANSSQFHEFFVALVNERLKLSAV